MSGFDVRDRIRSFRYAANGLRVVVRGEHNAWIHAVMTVAAVALGFLLGITRLEWCAVVIVIGGVWTAEAFNTALELLADAALPERDPRVGAAKDAAAGAVLVAAVAASVVGLLVFGPRLLALVGLA